MIKCAVILGKDKIIGSDGVLSVNQGDKRLEFFRIRSIFLPHVADSALAIDLDIKDVTNSLEIRLSNNKPVVLSLGVRVISSPTQVLVALENGTPILSVEQLNRSAILLPTPGLLQDFLTQNPIEVVFQLSGKFYAGMHLVQATTQPATTHFIAPGTAASGPGERELRLTPFGFSV